MIKPDDTDDVIESKKRKIQHVKSLQKEIRHDQAAERSAGSWRKFWHKDSKKQGLNKKKTSIFASKDNGKLY